MGRGGDPTGASGSVPERELHALPRRHRQGRRRARLRHRVLRRLAEEARRRARRRRRSDPGAARDRAPLQREVRLGLEFVEAFGEDVPLPDASFDIVFSEYGASIWADPYKWIPEAARLLRPGGELVFLRNSTLVLLCSPDDEDAPASETLQRPQFGMHEFQWPDSGIEYHLAHGDWIRLLRANGFEILDLIEIQAPADAATHEHYAYVTADWGRKWPAEEIWRARLST